MNTGEAERPEEAPRHLHDLSVERRRALADALDTHLGELMLPARLRPLGPEEGAGVLHSHRPDLLVEVRAQDRSERSGSPLGTQREGASAAILEAEHLLLDDVGVRADPAAEQLGRLDDRCLDRAIPERLGDRPMGVQEPPTSAELIGKDVARAAWRCDLRHWRPSVRAQGFNETPSARSAEARRKPRGVGRIIEDDREGEVVAEAVDRAQCPLAPGGNRPGTATGRAVQGVHAEQHRSAAMHADDGAGSGCGDHEAGTVTAEYPDAE